MNRKSRKRQVNWSNLNRLKTVQHAIDLFQAGIISLEIAAFITHLPIEEFVEELGKRNIPIENYDPEYFRQEVDLLGEEAPTTEHSKRQSGHGDQPLPDGLFE